MNNKGYSVLSAVGRCARSSPWLTLGLAASVAGAVVSVLIPPLVLEKIVNSLSGGYAIDPALAVGYFVALAASGTFDALKEMLITVFGQKIARRVRSDMCCKLMRMPAAYFTANEPGVTAARFAGDVDTLETLFASGVVGMAVDACKVIGILTVIFVKSRGLGLLLMAATPLLFVFTRFIQKKMLSAQKKNRESVGKLNGFVPETIRNIRMIHVFRREEHMEQKYDKTVESSYKAIEKINFYDAVYSPVIHTASAAIIGVMMVLAASGGEVQSFFGMSVGTAVAVIAYVGRVFSPLESIGMEIQTVQSAAAGVQRIKGLMNEPERAQADESLTAEGLISSGKPAVQMDNVSFSYDGEQQVLTNLSFAVQEGESITVAGRTGAGKSTVLKLLLGFYAPQSGSALVFGERGDGIPDSCKRRVFGYVEQSFRPVPGNIADQIAVFDPQITQADVEKAAALAGIDKTISALADGYLTPYSDSLFSQGQKQLIAVARAVAADPRILMLDEITANLDAETEEKVLSALEKASAKRTVISVSHRLYEHSGGQVINI